MSHNTHERIRNLSHVSFISLALLFFYFIISYKLFIFICGTPFERGVFRKQVEVILRVFWPKQKQRRKLFFVFSLLATNPNSDEDPKIESRMVKENFETVI